jgi:hypothetical protein
MSTFSRGLVVLEVQQRGLKFLKHGNVYIAFLLDEVRKKQQGSF